MCVPCTSELCVILFYFLILLYILVLISFPQNIGSMNGRNESTVSQDTASSISTVKWRDTMDVEFSMGRTYAGNKSAPDAWYVRIYFNCFIML